MNLFEAQQFMRAYYGGKEPTLEQLDYCAGGIQVLEGDITPEAQQAANIILESYKANVCPAGEQFYTSPNGKLPSDDPAIRKAAGLSR